MKKLMVVIFTILAIYPAGDIYARYKVKTGNSLNIKQRSIIPIAAYTAEGELQKLKSALNTGLDAGLTVNEIKEIIVHLYAYCGFPRSIRGMQTFMEVLSERKAKGIIDIQGAEASPVVDNISKYEQGRKNLEKLTGVPQSEVKSGYAAFSPILDVFLKEHLFADIFQRDVLTFAERELVTISALGAIGGVEPMLSSHLSICLNVGFTTEQLIEYVSIIRKVVGKKEGKTVRAVLNEILKNRQSQ